MMHGKGFRPFSGADEHPYRRHGVAAFGLSDEEDVQSFLKVFFQSRKDTGIHRLRTLPFAFSMLLTALSRASVKMCMEVSLAASSTSGATA